MIKKFALVGAGYRGLRMFARPIAEHYRESAKLVGIYDLNPIRAKYVSDECGGVPVYNDFDRMLSESGAHTVIVTTVDSTHHEYIIRALRIGFDVITEKPMTTDERKCRAILEAERETGKSVTVTFNVRYTQIASRVKELIASGAIGRVLSVNLEYLLDTDHGADYFRRWHRHLEYSGGLLVHKSTHHFDMINWWISDEPELVYAFGATLFYGATRKKRGERCLTCDYKKSCDFYFNIENNRDIHNLYLNAEDEDGYIRDQCVFADGITTYDTMSLNLKYAGGALLNYSLIAHCPYEGWRCSINGTDGRIEARSFEEMMASDSNREMIRLFNRRGEIIDYHIPISEGDHGGSDWLLQQTLFSEDIIDDPLGRQAGSKDGAASVLIGIAANKSIATGQPIRVMDLIHY